jgi:predicted nucleic acid-binding protein
MPVLVDTSIWIEYFRSGNESEKLDFLIDENLIVTNDLILAELVPSLKVRNQRNIIKLLYDINELELSINWDEIIGDQGIPIFFSIFRSAASRASVSRGLLKNSAASRSKAFFSALCPHVR